MESVVEILGRALSLELVLLVVGLVGLLYWYGTSNKRLMSKLNVPGPKPRMFVGSLPEVKNHGGMHLMIYNYVREYGKVFAICIGRKPSLVVSDPEILKQIMIKNFANFRNRFFPTRPQPPLSRSVFAAENDDWKRVRTILTPTFSAAKMKQMLPLIEESCDTLMKKLDEVADTGTSLCAQCGHFSVCLCQRSWYLLKWLRPSVSLCLHTQITGATASYYVVGQVTHSQVARMSVSSRRDGVAWCQEEMQGSTGFLCMGLSVSCVDLRSFRPCAASDFSSDVAKATKHSCRICIWKSNWTRGCAVALLLRDDRVPTKMCLNLIRFASFSYFIAPLPMLPDVSETAFVQVYVHTPIHTDLPRSFAISYPANRTLS